MQIKVSSVKYESGAATHLTGRGAVHPGGCIEPLSSSPSPGPAGYPSPEGTDTPKDGMRESLSSLVSEKAKCDKQTKKKKEENLNTHIVVRPQLQATGADAEDAGEELIGCKELRDVKVLRQVWELFAQISRFLWERHSCSHTEDMFAIKTTKQSLHSTALTVLIPFVRPLPVIGGNSSHPKRPRTLCH